MIQTEFLGSPVFEESLDHMEMDSTEFCDKGSDSSGKLGRHIRHKHTEFLGYKDLKQNLNVKYDKNSKLPVFKCQ